MFAPRSEGTPAAAAMLIDRRIDAGLDMDGFLFGKVAVTGLGRPLILFSADPVFRRRPNLAEFWSRLTGRYAVDFAGAPTSRSPTSLFSYPRLADTSEAGAQARLRRPLVGTIDPTVACAAERAYVLAYFDRALKSKGAIPTRINSFAGVRAIGH